MWIELITIWILLIISLIGILTFVAWNNRRNRLLNHIKQSEQVHTGLMELSGRGWSEKALATVFLKPILQLPQAEIPEYVQQFVTESALFASKNYYRLLRAESHSLDREKAVKIIAQSVRMLDFPEELHQSHLSYLVEKMDCDCPPHHPFWQYFARLVDRAFPGQQLSRTELLNKQVHQLRYLISYQQASWVRKHFGQGNTDWQAMVAYLNHLPRWSYRLNESARLHNKRGFGDHKVEPLPVNIKVLIGFHSEFILSQQRQFALISDKTPHRNGVVNGASFNYASANNKRHTQLDIAPVGPHDPQFRKKVLRAKTASYLSPTRIRHYQRGKTPVGWERSYFNPDGDFSFAGNSRARLVSQLSRQLRADIHKLDS